ncbi:MAG: hypothetical protein AAF443_05585 [Chlamydiota bacterium]
MIWRSYFDRLFPWVLIRQVDKTQGKIGQKGPPNSARFLQIESSSVYTEAFEFFTGLLLSKTRFQKSRQASRAALGKLFRALRLYFSLCFLYL